MPMSLGNTDGLETPVILAKPAPCVSACIDAVDEAMRHDHPNHGMSAMQRAWLAFCVTATLVTHAMCWARCARASLGTYSMAALSWMVRQSNMPWAHLLVASVRVMLCHHGITSGSLSIDDTENPRSKAANKLAYLSKRRAQESGGSLWGHSLVLLVVVTPNISLPVGLTFSQPAPERRAWDQRGQALKKQQVPTAPRPPTPAPHPHYPTTQHLALRLLEACKATHPALRAHGITAETLSGVAPCVEAASALCGGVQMLWQSRRHQHIRIGKREHHVADSVATPLGTPQRLGLRGAAEMGAMVRRARFYGCSHHTKRFVVAMKDEHEETSRSLMASARRWRTLDMVQGHSLRWLVEVCMQDWKGHEGWAQLTKQPGEEGAPHRVILRLLDAHSLFVHPNQEAQLTNTLPAYPVGSLRAHVQVGCLVHVIDDPVSSGEPQDQLKRFTQAIHDVFALSRSTKHMIQRQRGRLEPTPLLKYPANEVMRNMPAMST